MKMTTKIAGIVVGLVLGLVFGFTAPALGAEDPLPADPKALPAPNPVVPDAPAPMTDIHDIRLPVPVGGAVPWLIPTLLSLAAALIVAALIWWWRRHRKKQAIETIVPELPPEMVAMQALDEISDVRGKDGKVFYFRLSAILRQYIFGRFGVGAPEMTTEEFLPCIERLSVERELASQLKQLCRAMDPVKFGGVTTMEKQMEADLLFVRALVRQTASASVADEPSGEKDSAAPTALLPPPLGEA